MERYEAFEKKAMEKVRVGSFVCTETEDQCHQMTEVFADHVLAVPVDGADDDKPIGEPIHIDANVLCLFRDEGESDDDVWLAS